ncbi:MAG: hypothetical protein HND57_15450 [Planctomycetes bacterium]|nr:hypothetical protein [Planctomycetota bacterium]
MGFDSTRPVPGAQAQRAVVWVHPYYDSSMDVDILEVVVYLDKVSDVGRPSGFSAAGRDVLVTAGLYGEVHLGSDVFIEAAPDMPGLLDNADGRFLSWQQRTTVTQLGPAIDLEKPIKRLPIGEAWDEPGQRLAQDGQRQPGEQWVPGGTRSEQVVGQGGWARAGSRLDQSASGRDSAADRQCAVSVDRQRGRGVRHAVGQSGRAVSRT